MLAGLKAKLPFLRVMIVTVTLGGGVGVGEGFGVGVGEGFGVGVGEGFGVGVGCGGFVGVGVGLDAVAVGVGVDFDGVVGVDAGVEPALVGVSVGAPETRAVVGVGVGLLFVLLVLPPHAANRARITSPNRQNQAILP
jgi:hypothetical protein